jgi:hypothetical protein
LLDIVVKDTGTPRGRGVFANKAFVKGEVVEICPVIVLSTPYSELIEELRLIVFQWIREKPPKRNVQALVLGYGSLYNHANPSNMRWEADRPALVIRYVADRDIGNGEELTINYNSAGGGTTSESDWWFEQTKTQLIN